MKDTTKRWLEAAKILCEDPNQSVRCPECNESDLTVKDVESGSIVERHLICPKCNKYNAMRMSKPVKIPAADYTKIEPN